MNECSREIEWAGGTHTFNLNEPKVLAILSRSPDAPRCARTRSGVLDLRPLDGSPAATLRRFDESEYSIADVERVILYGLWGGGLSLSDAEALVAEHVTGKPLAHSAQVAFAVISALFIGAQTDAA